MSRRSAQRGFTFVEVMTVMAILATLLALGWTGFRASALRAGEAVCANNLHQIGLAAVNQRIDGNHNFTSNTWPSTLLPYLGRSIASYACPQHVEPYDDPYPMLRVDVNDRHGRFVQSLLMREGPMVRRRDKPHGGYALWFEDLPGGGDRDFDDFVVQVDPLPRGRFAIDARRGSAGHRFDIVDGDGAVLYGNVGSEGTRFVFPEPEDLSRRVGYGMNQQADGLPATLHTGSTIFMLDYLRASAVVNDRPGLRDEWNRWREPSGELPFARHGGRANVLFMQGNVERVRPAEIDPAVSEAALRYWMARR